MRLHQTILRMDFLGNETDWAETHMEGGGCLEMKTETIRKRPVMRSRLMPERFKQDQGETDRKGEKGTVLLLPAAGMDA